MSRAIEHINKRTLLAGHNRLELLMFYLGADQLIYGINVFKVQEVILCPPVRSMPHAMPEIIGIVDIRGATIPVIDMALAIGKSMEPMAENGYLIVCEYNNQVVGFKVSGVSRIVNINWDEIKPPPKGLGKNCYMSSVTQVDGKFVEIIDVEKIMQQLGMGASAAVDMSGYSAQGESDQHRFVMVVDDSAVARRQIAERLAAAGVKYVLRNDGREALSFLEELAENEANLSNLALVISDIEMPNLDGYTLAAEIRKSKRLSGLKVVLHSSLTGSFNEALVEKVGADKFISKYDPDILMSTIIESI